MNSELLSTFCQSLHVHLYVVPGFYCLPVMSTSSSLTKSPKKMISMRHKKQSMDVMDNLAMLFHDHGQFRFLLVQFWIWSKNARSHRKPHGTKTRTVLWKQGVKSGLVVYHVRFVSQNGPAQNVVSVSIAGPCYWTRIQCPLTLEMVSFLNLWYNVAIFQSVWNNIGLHVSLRLVW